MKLDITLPEVLDRATPPLRAKILKSIELIQKSEPLALSYDQENGFWLGQSGGKDSQVLMHLAQLANVKFKAYFSPTSVDPPEVIRFIRRNYPETEFTPLTHSIYDEFIKRKCLPSMRIRYCCEVFKEQGGENKVVLVGVRHSESARRAKRQAVEVTGHKFSGDLEGFKEWSDKRKAKKRKQFDQFSDHKESMVTCINGKDKIVISPILDWLDSDVWEFLNDVLRVPHCELYDQGWTRIGCICCPMASPKNTHRDIERWPYVKEKWIKAIMKIRRESLEATSQITPPHSDTSTVAETTGYLVSRPGWIPPQYFQSKWAEGGTALPQSDKACKIGGAKSIAKTSPRPMERSF